VPFVLGPLNGGLPWPAAYRDALKREREYLTHLRRVFRLLPYHAPTYARARAVLASFRHTLADLPESAQPAAFHFPEVGIDPSLFYPPARPRPQGPLTLLFAGRLVPLKCVDVLITALAASPALRASRLLIVGEGSERAAWTKLASEKGVAGRVEFLGWKSQTEVADLMRSADVFAFPSIRELGAGVVVEAMACGCVPVVVDYGGPGGLVDDVCGVRVPLSGRAELSVAFTRALESLAADPAHLRDLRAAGVARAMASYTWAAKARKTVEIYEWVLGLRTRRPEFGDEALSAPPAEPSPVSAARG
jgi:glycosyltransferase involved in cell wall biosynthesis